MIEPPVKGHSVRFVAAVWLTFAPAMALVYMYCIKVREEEEGK